MKEDNIIKKKKKNNNYRYHRNHNQNRYYYKNKNNKKKNLITDNNDTGEIKNILLFNEQKAMPKEEVNETIQVINENIPDYEEIAVVPKKRLEKRINLMNKNVLKYGVGILVLIVAILGTSYSFFNYTMVDSRQADISTGEIYVKLMENMQNITLSKMYPRTNEEARSRNDNYFDFTIKGKNTSPTKAVLYSFSITNGEDVTGKTRINPEYISIDLQEKVNNNYVYIKEGVSLNSFSFIGIIPTNTTNEITKEYRLRIWVNDSIIISDTEANASYTQAEFNNLFANFNVSIESEDKDMAYSMFAKNVDTETTINFANKSSDSNGKGLYILPGTENNSFPIYYYRGEIDDNNVVFGDFCWKMVRTTDTGGIKMIYNGPASESFENQETLGNTEYNYTNDSTYPYTYDSSTKKWSNSTIPGDTAGKATFVFTPKEASNYDINYELITSYMNIYINDVLVADYSSYHSGILNLGPLSTTDVIKIESYYTYIAEQAKFSIVKKYGNQVTVCNNINKHHIGETTDFSSASIFSQYGYMYNKEYQKNEDYQNTPSNAIFGKSVEWDGTNYLVVDDTPGVASSNTTLDNNHHYTCGTSGGTSCTSVRYYYGTRSNFYSYIILTDGDTIEDAIYKMTGNGSTETKTKNANYKLNTKDSTAKTNIENWFKTNLTNEVDSTKINYVEYLEDTVYCNDRSFKSQSDYTQSGWSPTGTLADGDSISFGSKSRFENSWYSTSNVPTTSCPNVTDSFSVGNSLAKLKYPVGLLTADEVIMAGAAGSGVDYNMNMYLSNGSSSYFTLLSPLIGATRFTTSIGVLFEGAVMTYYNPSYMPLQPVVSLKLGTTFEPGGNGTPTNPYIVKYN